MLRPGIRRLLRLRGFTAQDAMREVDEEVRLHVELRAAELMGEGLDADSAMSEAGRLFARDAGALEALYGTAIERDDHMRMRERLESLLHDVRYAFRALVQDPALTVFVVLTLALGIGANVTSWSLVDRLLVRDPAHVVEPDRVIRLYGEIDQGDAGPRASSWIPYSAYRQFRELSSFAAVGAYRIVESHVGTGVEARRLRVGHALGAFFPLLGVKPVAGRLFAADEDAATAGELAVLSHELWRADHGSDVNVMGQSSVIDGVPRTIVGVAPPGFTGTEPRRVDVWVLASSATAGTTNWTIVGRLRPGVTPGAATAEATAIHEPDAAGSFAWFRDARIFTAPLTSGADGRESVEATLARWLAGVSAIILLITFANVVNLLLVRVVRRRRELAIRVSLGAGRARVIRLIAVEGVLLAVMSGIASLLVAHLLEPVVRRALLADQAGWAFTVADGRLLALVGAIVLLTVVCVGTVPALQAGRADVAHALRGGQRAGSASLRLRGMLTVVQAALSVVLLVGAGLFMRSFANVRALDLGVDRDRVITVEATLPSFGSFGPGVFDSYTHMERDIYRRLERAVQRLPGVEQVGVAVGLPLDGGSFGAAVWVPGRDSIPSLPGGGPYVSTVTASYFHAIGTRIVRGRAFTDADREGSEPVVIINETMATMLWPGTNALNQCVHISSPTSPCARIVGVAEDVHRVGLREQASLQYYLPLGQQNMFGGAKLVVRPTVAAPVSALALQRAIVAEEPAVRAVEVRALHESLAGEVRPLRIGLVTFGISGAVALAVALLGLYSMMAYMVAWRTHEIGVRVALGASRSRVVTMVLRTGIILAGAGIAAGLVLAGFVGRWLQPHLFDTSVRDSTVMVLAAAALLMTAAVAGLVPARRATRISPTEALRSE